MQSEVDQSLKDLTDNINTEKALQTISLHMQKAADNVHELPKLGDKVTTIIIRESKIHRIILQKVKRTPFSVWIFQVGCAFIVTIHLSLQTPGLTTTHATTTIAAADDDDTTRRHQLHQSYEDSNDNKMINKTINDTLYLLSTSSFAVSSNSDFMKR